MGTRFLQELAHSGCGDSDKEGATYGFAPMNPRTLHVCLSFMRDDPTAAAAYERAASTARDGPAFLEWEKQLRLLNKALVSAGLEEIRRVPICPSAKCGTFAALWPVGFPHGSHRNSGRRVTTTAPLSISKQISSDQSVPNRVFALAELAEPTGNRELALELIESQTTPFAGGTTHARPDLVAHWYDRDTGGPFAAIAPTHEDAARFIAAWERDRCESMQAAEHALQRPDMPLIPPYGPRGSDSAAWKVEIERLTASWNTNGAWAAEDTVPVLTRTVDAVPESTSSLQALLEGLASPDTIYVNIQEPWASLIAAGVKCVENRPNALPPKVKWAVLIASKPCMSEAEMERRKGDYKRRLRWSGQQERVSVKRPREYLATTSQCAVAFVKIKSAANEDGAHQSIWNNGDKYAWIIEEAVQFGDPVFKGDGVLGISYLNRPQGDPDKEAKMNAFRQELREQLAAAKAPA